MWNRSGTVPADVETLGDEVWRSDGIKVLGRPLGTAEFLEELMDNGWRRNDGSGKRSRTFPICSARGKSCSKAKIHEPTTHCELCLRTMRTHA